LLRKTLRTLQALAELKKYASAKGIDDDTVLQTSTQRLKDLCSRKPTLHAQAKLDLSDAMAQGTSRCRRCRCRVR